jgi:hypothetical protein
VEGSRAASLSGSAGAPAGFAPRVALRSLPGPALTIWSGVLAGPLGRCAIRKTTSAPFSSFASVPWGASAAPLLGLIEGGAKA